MHARTTMRPAPYDYRGKKMPERGAPSRRQRQAQVHAPLPARLSRQRGPHILVTRNDTGPESSPAPAPSFARPPTPPDEIPRFRMDHEIRMEVDDDPFTAPEGNPSNLVFKIPALPPPRGRRARRVKRTVTEKKAHLYAQWNDMLPHLREPLLCHLNGLVPSPATSCSAPGCRASARRVTCISWDCEWSLRLSPVSLY